MSKNIIIDDKEYSMDSLSDEIKAMLGLLQEAQNRASNYMVEMQLANSAIGHLRSQIAEHIKSVKPIPKPRVSTKKK